jgi:(1->4)-alpha-D-glucan 1-alpha-D-glucosylmutase
LQAFVRGMEKPGLYNSLTQVLLKVAAPGVPDFYQGSELWTFNLVDPDNRRPIDFADRRRTLDVLLREFEKDPIALAKKLIEQPEDGRIKMLVTALSLRFRRANEWLFRKGGYAACDVEGRRAPQAVAFARTGREKAVVAVAGRFFTRFGGGAAPVGDAWQDTRLTLPHGLQKSEYREIFTNRALTPTADGALELEQVLAVLPVALVEVRPPHS